MPRHLTVIERDSRIIALLRDQVSAYAKLNIAKIGLYLELIAKIERTSPLPTETVTMDGEQPEQSYEAPPIIGHYEDMDEELAALIEGSSPTVPTQRSVPAPRPAPVPLPRK